MNDYKIGDIVLLHNKKTNYDFDKGKGNTIGKIVKKVTWTTHWVKEQEGKQTEEEMTLTDVQYGIKIIKPNDETRCLDWLDYWHYDEHHIKCLKEDTK